MISFSRLPREMSRVSARLHEKGPRRKYSEDAFSEHMEDSSDKSTTKKARKDPNESNLNEEKENNPNIQSSSSAISDVCKSKKQPRAIKAPSVKRTKPSAPKKLTKKEKLARLITLGFEEDANRGNCARLAILRGHVTFTGEESELDQVVVSGKLECGHTCSATLREALEQPDMPGSGCEEEATVSCDMSKDHSDVNAFCGRTAFVTKLCKGKPSLEDNSGSVNHCSRCNKCISDWRYEHCDRCGTHFWAGAAGRSCTNCGGSDRDRDTDSDDSSRVPENCCIS